MPNETSLINSNFNSQTNTSNIVTKSKLYLFLGTANILGVLFFLFSINEIKVLTTVFTYPLNDLLIPSQIFFQYVSWLLFLSATLVSLRGIFLITINEKKILHTIFLVSFFIFLIVSALSGFINIGFQINRNVAESMIVILEISILITFVTSLIKMKRGIFLLWLIIILLISTIFFILSLYFPENKLTQVGSHYCQINTSISKTENEKIKQDCVKDYEIIDTATQTNNIGLCKQIKAFGRSYECYSNFLKNQEWIKNNTPMYCESLENIFIADECYLEYVKISKDTTYCNRIRSMGSIKNSCSEIK